MILDYSYRIFFFLRKQVKYNSAYSNFRWSFVTEVKSSSVSFFAKLWNI